MIVLAGGGHDGPVTITAPEAPTFADVAGMASELVARTIGFEVVDAERWVDDQVAAGTSEPQVRFTVGMYEAAAGGFFAGVDPLLTELLGRTPRTARDAVAE